MGVTAERTAEQGLHRREVGTRRRDAALAAKLEEVCPVDIFEDPAGGRDSRAQPRRVRTRRLCIEASTQGAVRVKSSTTHELAYSALLRALERAFLRAAPDPEHRRSSSSEVDRPRSARWLAASPATSAAIARSARPERELSRGRGGARVWIQRPEAQLVELAGRARVRTNSGGGSRMTRSALGSEVGAAMHVGERLQPHPPKPSSISTPPTATG